MQCGLLKSSPIRCTFGIARAAGLLVAAFLALVVVGYLSGESGLYRPRPDGPSTHPITVVMAVAIGWGLSLSSPIRELTRAARCLFLFATGLALARLAGMAFVDHSDGVVGAVFDRLGGSLRHADDHGNTGLNTLLTGILIALGQLLRSWRPRWAMLAAAVAPVSPLVAFFGYSFGFEHFHGEMSPITAGLLLPLALIGLMNFVRRPMLRPLFSGTAYGRGARMEFLAAIGFPWLLGAVLSRPDAGGSSNTAIQSALMAMFAVTVVVVKTRAHALTERQRQRSIRALHAAAVSDHLTGLTNRHGATMQIEALAAGRPVGVILADLDHFKMINDVWGHATGDRVLRDAARIFKERLRSGQIVARWGGEEFLVVLPGIDLDGALAVAEQLRAGLATLRGPAGNLGEITASFGVSERDAGEVTLDGAIQRADVALYHAKECGRDRVVRENACAGRTSAPGAGFDTGLFQADNEAAACRPAAAVRGKLPCERPVAPVTPEPGRPGPSG